MPCPDTPAHISRGKAAESTDLIVTRRYELVMELAQPGGGTLLDFGCGNGAQTLFLVPHFNQTIAIDVDEDYLSELARTLRRNNEQRVLPLCYGGDTLPVQSTSIDFAVSFEVLEHVHDELLSLRELHRVLRPNGVLVMSVPNRWWVFETHGAALPGLRWNRVPFFSWLPKRLHDRWARARIYSRAEIVRKLKSAGFSVRDAIYVTAPMDAVGNPRLRRVLRQVIFRGARTPVPLFSTAVMVVAKRT